MADMSKSTKEQMNDPSSGLIPSKVSRKTVADGSWLQKYTFGKLSARDDFLADQIDGVSGNLASAYDDMVEDITDLQDDVVSLSDEIKNMSPLTYRGNDSVSAIKNKTDKRNGDVYSITGLTGSSAKSGVWWIGGTTKSGDNDFKVKNNDEVAYTSAGDRWFPIGQDIHVEYSAVSPVYVENGQMIGIYSSATDKWNDVVNKLNIDDINVENNKITSIKINDVQIPIGGSIDKIYLDGSANPLSIVQGSVIIPTVVTGNDNEGYNGLMSIQDKTKLDNITILTAGTDLTINNSVIGVNTDGTVVNSADMSFVAGSGTYASGTGAMAIGINTSAVGKASNAEGEHTIASGYYSNAGGYYTTAEDACMTVIGRYNKTTTNAAFVVGNGSPSLNGRSDAFVVGWNGSISSTSISSTKINTTDITIGPNNKINTNGITSINLSSNNTITAGGLQLDNYILPTSYIGTTNGLYWNTSNSVTAGGSLWREKYFRIESTAGLFDEAGMRAHWLGSSVTSRLTLEINPNNTNSFDIETRSLLKTSITYGMLNIKVSACDSGDWHFTYQGCNLSGTNSSSEYSYNGPNAQQRAFWFDVSRVIKITWDLYSKYLYIKGF